MLRVLHAACYYFSCCGFDISTIKDIVSRSQTCLDPDTDAQRKLTNRADHLALTAIASHGVHATIESRVGTGR